MSAAERMRRDGWRPRGVCGWWTLRVSGVECDVRDGMVSAVYRSSISGQQERVYQCVGAAGVRAAAQRAKALARRVRDWGRS